MREIYLDNSATTKPYKEVITAVNEAMETMYYNPSSIYSKGVEVSKKIEIIREKIADTLNTKDKNIVFTSGGTESVNTAINTAVKSTRGKHIVTTAYEHDCTLKTLKKLESEGYEVTYVKPRDGEIKLEDILSAVTEHTILVTVMHVNNEIGNIIDIYSLGKELKKQNPNVYFHIDAVQSYMKLKLDVQKANADFLSISGHKIHGVKGTGVLFVKDTQKFQPLIYGGGQEKGYRSGTENTVGIFALGSAVSEGFSKFEENVSRISELKNHLKTQILENIDRVKINSQDEGVCHVLNVSFLGAKAEILLHTLESEGIYVSTGSACSSKKKGSHVLNSIGLKENEIQGAIRFSLSSLNTKEEIDTLMPILKKAVEEIRIITKFGRR